MFEKLQPTKLDPILGLSQLFQADPRSEKVDLGIGVYKDDEGITPIMSSVKRLKLGCLLSNLQRLMLHWLEQSCFVIRCVILFLAMQF